MKKTIITIVITVVVMILGIIGAKLLLSSGDKTPDPADATYIPIAATPETPAVVADPTPAVDPVVPAVTPTLPGSDEPIKFLDIGIASFNYDSTKLVFDEIPSDEENGIPMVSFMPSDAEDILPRVDAMPIKVSNTGEGDQNFYNMNEESWQNLVAACVLKYLSPAGQEQAQLSFSDTVVKREDNASMKMFTNVSINVPSDISAQTGDLNMNGSIRLIANGENAVITMAMYRQNSSLPEALKDAYMSLQVRP